MEHGPASPSRAPLRAAPLAPRRSRLAQVLAAQESGLILVIALVMAALTFLGGQKSQPFLVEVPSAAEVTRNADFFIVKAGEITEYFARDAGWEIQKTGAVRRVLRQDEVTETVETRPLPVGADINESGGVITVTTGSEKSTFAIADGWRIDEANDGVSRLVREKRVSRLVDVPSAPQEGKFEVTETEILLHGAGIVAHYPRTTGWRLVEESPASRTLIGARIVNRFFEKENLVLLTTRASYFAVMAVGMTAIIVLAGIDLSVGSIYAVAAVVGALALSKLSPGASAWVAVPVGVVACCAMGAVLGAINGGMTVGLRLHPFIITLGTMAIYRGLVKLLTGGVTVSGLPESIQKGFFKAEYAGVYPVLTIIMIIVAAIGSFVMAATVLGRRIYAIGGNETAAYYAGVPVGRVKIIVYTLGGMLAGLSACMEVGYNATASVGAGQGYELNVIAAAVIGGASLSGGRGSAIGAVLGAILVSLIDNAMVILGIPQDYNQIVMGAAIVIAVAVDQLKRRYLKT